MKEKNNFFTHKFLPILSIILLILFVFTTNCFASFNFSCDDVDYSFPDLPEDISNYYIIFKNDSSFLLYSCNNEFSITPSTYSCLFVFNGGFKDTFSCKSNDSSWTFLNRQEFDSVTSLNISLSFDDILYSNFNIKNSSGEVVFQGAPQKVEQVTIPKLETAQEIPQTMNKVLQMIIPIGLIVFLCGLLIYLTRLVILRMI